MTFSVPFISTPSTRCLTEFVPWLCVRKSVSLMSFRSSFVIHEIRPNFPPPSPSLPKANHCDLISAVPPGPPRIPNPLDNHVTKSISERICPRFCDFCILECDSSSSFDSSNVYLYLIDMFAFSISKEENKEVYIVLNKRTRLLRLAKLSHLNHLTMLLA